MTYEERIEAAKQRAGISIGEAMMKAWRDNVGYDAKPIKRMSKADRAEAAMWVRMLQPKTDAELAVLIDESDHWHRETQADRRGYISALYTEHGRRLADPIRIVKRQLEAERAEFVAKMAADVARMPKDVYAGLQRKIAAQAKELERLNTPLREAKEKRKQGAIDDGRIPAGMMAADAVKLWWESINQPAPGSQEAHDAGKRELEWDKADARRKAAGKTPRGKSPSLRTIRTARKAEIKAMDHSTLQSLANWLDTLPDGILDWELKAVVAEIKARRK